METFQNAEEHTTVKCKQGRSYAESGQAQHLLRQEVVVILQEVGQLQSDTIFIHYLILVLLFCFHIRLYVLGVFLCP